MIEVELKTWDNDHLITTAWIPKTAVLPTMLVYRIGKNNSYFLRDNFDQGRADKPRYLEIDDVLVISPVAHEPIDQKAAVAKVIDQIEKKAKEAS